MLFWLRLDFFPPFFWAAAVVLLPLLLLFTQEYCFGPDSVGEGLLSPGEACGENV
jgi:hypothetical protein